MSKDINGKRISIEDSKTIINDILATSAEGETFKGAVPSGQVGEEYPLPRSVQEAQIKEIELRNRGDMRAAGQFSQGFLGTIAQKLIYQTILTAPYSNELSFIERFRGQTIEYGTGKEYVATQMSGFQKLDPEAFNPTRTTKPTVINQVNTFLNENGQLNTATKAFMNQHCMSIQQYATKEFMLSDVKLQQFIQTMKDSVISGAKLWLYNEIMTHIKEGIASASTTPNGSAWTKIEGTAPDMFNACIEICEHVEKLTMMGNEYQLVRYPDNQKQLNFVRGASASDLNWIWSIKNANKARRGIASQTYNYKLWTDKGGINDSNVYTPYKKVSLPDLTTSSANNFPTMTNEYWIDDNTVVILETNAIEFNLLWEKMETQYYTNNMTLQLTYNIAGMINTIKTMRGFVYTNRNLGTF